MDNAQSKIIRFDDICINCDTEKAQAMARYAMEDGYDVWFCISPFVSDMSREPAPECERVFAGILKAYSDFRVFYSVDKCGIPEIANDEIDICSHGLIHVDHRLLHPAAQEMSIITSCHLLNTQVFVPPFNKWNTDTEQICKDNFIELIKFEDGWLSMEHNLYRVDQAKWYLHSREWTLEKFKSWFK